MLEFLKNQWSRLNWKAYIAEFVMLLMAVIAGFMTDSYLEYRQDREKERDFLRQMVEDLKMDTMNIAATARTHEIFFMEARALSELAYGDYHKLEHQIKMYQLALGVLTKNLVVPFSKGSMNQLIYSGGLRTVMDAQITNDITDYDSQLETIDQQREGMMIRNHALIEEARSVFYYKAWLNTLSFDQVTFNPQVVEDMYNERGSGLLTENNEKIMQFANAALVFSGYASFYKNKCLKQKQFAEKLILEIEEYLKKL